MKLTKLQKRSLNKGLLTIEASLVFIIFFAGYIFLNSFILSSFVESNTKKAINATAMDLSVYAEVSEGFKISDLLVVKDNPLNINQLFGMIGKSLSKPVSNKTLTDLSSDYISIMKNKIKNDVYSHALQGLLKKIVSNKLGGNDTLLRYGVDHGVNGLDFTSSKLLDNGLIEINLKYKLNLKAMNLFTHKRLVCQKAYIQTNINPSNVDHDNKESIWNESNFNRGRFFAKFLRDNTSNLVIRSGQGLDLYNKATKIVSQMYSMNIFKASYSEKTDEKYKLNINEIQKQINQYCKKAKENLLKLNGRLILENGQIINVNPDSKIELIMIMPNEAKEYSELNGLADNLPAGFSLKIEYMEDALID